jgi:hypothetical protein
MKIDRHTLEIVGSWKVKKILIWQYLWSMITLIVAFAFGIESLQGISATYCAACIIGVAISTGVNLYLAYWQ